MYSIFRLSECVDDFLDDEILSMGDEFSRDFLHRMIFHTISWMHGNRRCRSDYFFMIEKDEGELYIRPVRNLDDEDDDDVVYIVKIHNTRNNSFVSISSDEGTGVSESSLYYLYEESMDLEDIVKGIGMSLDEAYYALKEG